MDEETSDAAKALHREMASADLLLGVDAPKESDHIYRLAIDQCFYVGGMGTRSEAEVIETEEYR